MFFDESEHKSSVLEVVRFRASVARFRTATLEIAAIVGVSICSFSNTPARFRAIVPASTVRIRSVETSVTGARPLPVGCSLLIGSCIH